MATPRLSAPLKADIECAKQHDDEQYSKSDAPLPLAFGQPHKCRDYDKQQRQRASHHPKQILRIRHGFILFLWRTLWAGLYHFYAAHALNSVFAAPLLPRCRLD